MKKTKVGQDLIHGLTEVLAHVRGEITLRTTDLELPPGPPEYTKDEIRKLRMKLKFSQGVFGVMLGVNDQTVRSWESGKKKPSPSARRLIEMIAESPTVVQDTLKVKCRSR